MKNNLKPSIAPKPVNTWAIIACFLLNPDWIKIAKSPTS